MDVTAVRTQTLCDYVEVFLLAQNIVANLGQSATWHLLKTHLGPQGLAGAGDVLPFRGVYRFTLNGFAQGVPQK